MNEGNGVIYGRRPATWVLVGLVRGYQRFVSPLFPPSCRFYPCCSTYAVEALTAHGALRGCWLTLRRLLRCGPWHPGGVDLVPPAYQRHTDQRHTDRPNTRERRMIATPAEE